MTGTRLTPARHPGGRPVDMAKRARILEVHRARPELTTYKAIAAAVPCDQRLVARVLPGLAVKPIGVGAKSKRVQLPAHLVDEAMRHGGLVRVIVAGLRALKPTP